MKLTAVPNDKKLVALVTGCTTRSIGFAFCQNLLNKGFIVYATSRSSKTIIGLDHPRAKILDLDVTNDQQVTASIERIIQDEGQIDLLINNAAIFAPGPVIDATPEKMKEAYDVNVVSILRLCKSVIFHMTKRREGMILNMGSILGSFPLPWVGIYASSKAAIRNLTEVLYLECRPFNIKVILVEPGGIKSTMMRRFDGYELPQNSLYNSFGQTVRKILDTIQDPRVTPADAFAETVLSKVLRSKGEPPIHIRTGFTVTIFSLLGMLPRKMYLNTTWKLAESRHLQPRK